MVVEAQYYPRPLQNLLGHDRALTEGRRTVGNSPEYFPHLEIPSCRFLYGVVTVARSFEIHFLRSALHNHIPSPIQGLVDVSEALVRRKDSEPVISSPSYSLRFVDLITEPQDKTTANIDPPKIEMLKMIFFSNGNSSNVGEVQTYFYPNTRRVYGEPKYSFLEGSTRDVARDVLSSKRMPAEDVAQVLDGYEEDPAAFRMISDGAELEIIFREGKTLAVTRSKGRELTETTYHGLAICRLSITGTKTKKEEVTKIPFPLSDFCGAKVLESQEEIEEWLLKMTLDLAKKAKPGK